MDRSSYTKAEVIKGLQCCILHDPDDKPRCDDCPFDNNCVNRLKMAALELINKSDFEVISEIMSRSKNACTDNHSDIQGDLVIKAHLDLCFNFDAGGNIL